MRLTRTKLLVLVLVLVAFVFVGCQNNIKTPDEMTPKEKAAFFLSMYNKQFDGYLDTIIDPALPFAEREALKESIKDGAVLPADKMNPNLTNEQKDILRTKKEIMTEVYPLISLYTSYAESGSVPSAETETQIISLLDRLAATVVKP